MGVSFSFFFSCSKFLLARIVDDTCAVGCAEGVLGGGGEGWCSIWERLCWDRFCWEGGTASTYALTGRSRRDLFPRPSCFDMVLCSV